MTDLVVLGFNATLAAKVISWRSVTHICDTHVFPGFLTNRLLFSQASEVRGENQLERKFASTRYQTHNHQVMSQTCSPLTQLGRAVTDGLNGIMHYKEEKKKPSIAKAGLIMFCCECTYNAIFNLSLQRNLIISNMLPTELHSKSNSCKIVYTVRSSNIWKHFLLFPYL